MPSELEKKVKEKVDEIFPRSATNVVEEEENVLLGVQISHMPLEKHQDLIDMGFELEEEQENHVHYTVNKSRIFF